MKDAIDGHKRIVFPAFDFSTKRIGFATKENRNVLRKSTRQQPNSITLLCSTDHQPQPPYLLRPHPSTTIPSTLQSFPLVKSYSNQYSNIPSSFTSQDCSSTSDKPINRLLMHPSESPTSISI